MFISFLLCGIFPMCLYSLQNKYLDYLCAVDAQHFWLATSCVVRTDHKHRRWNLQVCHRNFTQCSHQNDAVTRDALNTKDKLLLMPRGLGITVCFLRHLIQYFASIVVECRKPKNIHSNHKSSYFSFTDIWKWHLRKYVCMFCATIISMLSSSEHVSERIFWVVASRKKH